MFPPEKIIKTEAKNNIHLFKSSLSYPTTLKVVVNPLSPFVFFLGVTGPGIGVIDPSGSEVICPDLVVLSPLIV